MTEVSRKINRGWTTRDIMVTAILSIALGVLYIPLTYLTGYLMAVPFILPLIMGINFFPVILVVYLIRKPGVALFSAAVSMIVSVPFTPYGVMMLSQIITIGLPIEVVFLAGRYKHFKLWHLMLAGVIPSLCYALQYFVVYSMGNFSPLLQITFFGEAIISGAVFGGLLAKWIGDAVVKTGVVFNKS
jgi:energy-coupling factor transport system substrate-specific component